MHLHVKFMYACMYYNNYLHHDSMLYILDNVRLEILLFVIVDFFNLLHAHVLKLLFKL